MPSSAIITEGPIEFLRPTGSIVSEAVFVDIFQQTIAPFFLNAAKTDVGINSVVIEAELSRQCEVSIINSLSEPKHSDFLPLEQPEVDRFSREVTGLDADTEYSFWVQLRSGSSASVTKITAKTLPDLSPSVSSTSVSINSDIAIGTAVARVSSSVAGTFAFAKGNDLDWFELIPVSETEVDITTKQLIDYDETSYLELVVSVATVRGWDIGTTKITIQKVSNEPDIDAVTSDLRLYPGSNDGEPRAFYRENTQVFELYDFRSSTSGRHINDATVSLTIKNQLDENLLGQVWPLSLSPIGKGMYRATLPHTIATTVGESLKACIVADTVSGSHSEWNFTLNVKERDDYAPTN